MISRPCLNYECAGCSEAFLRTPDVGAIILETISVEYHETLMAASGLQAEKNLHGAVEKYKGQFVCIVEGAIATNYNGAYGKVADRAFLAIARDIVPKAAVVISIGRPMFAYGAAFILLILCTVLFVFSHGIKHLLRAKTIYRPNPL